MKAVSVEDIAVITKGSIINEGLKGRTAAINEFIFNSKDGFENTMFVPIVGERVDAHNFIKDAMEHHITASFTSRDSIEPETDSLTYVKVDNNLYAFQRFAEWNREQYKLPIIGITGSVGKTTTKEMLAAAFESEKCILKTIGNKNSQIGLAQMMLLIEDKHEVGIIEMGMSMKGEMKRLSDIAKPEACVITNIGVSHIGLLGSRENIRREKLNIINNFPEGGTIFLNADDEFLMEIYKLWKNGSSKDYEEFPLDDITKEKLKKSHIITYGINENSDCIAYNIKALETGTNFKMSMKKRDKSRLNMDITLCVPGIHNVRNALAAMASAVYYGVNPEMAANGLRLYKPEKMRGGIENINGITIIDDTYNASPDSMRSAVDVLRGIKSAKRSFIVLADVLELGEESEYYHREVGKYIVKNPVDVLITYGEEAVYIADEVKKSNVKTKVESFFELDEVINYLKSELKNGDAVSLKGSRGMKLDIAVSQLKDYFNIR